VREGGNQSDTAKAFNDEKHQKQELCKIFNLSFSGQAKPANTHPVYKEGVADVCFP
jgi:hypothetical protein